jgi:hypothetical protein
MLVQDDPFPAPSLADLSALTREGRLLLRVEAWHDPVIDELGYDPRSSYVEIFWLPVLGPPSSEAVQ